MRWTAFYESARSYRASNRVYLARLDSKVPVRDAEREGLRAVARKERGGLPDGLSPRIRPVAAASISSLCQRPE